MPARSDRSHPSTTTSIMTEMLAWRSDHPRATFAEIEVEATRQVAALRTELIAAAAAAGDPEPVPLCAACGQAMVRNGTRTRTLVTSQQAGVTVTGPRYRCSACGAEVFPPR